MTYILFITVLVGLLYPPVKHGLQELAIDVLQIIAWITKLMRKWLWPL